MCKEGSCLQNKSGPLGPGIEGQPSMSRTMSILRSMLNEKGLIEYLLVGKTRVLERVLVQQVARLGGELDSVALDQEGVVLLDKKPVMG